ncbi:hypothetical protein HY375_01670 [Candidatus Berkelbacteria bacterium]|nr:hypothetical protein [Candidatus Berkelbacteria bacterium]
MSKVRYYLIAVLFLVLAAGCSERPKDVETGFIPQLGVEWKKMARPDGSAIISYTFGSDYSSVELVPDVGGQGYIHLFVRCELRGVSHTCPLPGVSGNNDDVRVYIDSNLVAAWYPPGGGR